MTGSSLADTLGLAATAQRLLLRDPPVFVQAPGVHSITGTGLVRAGPGFVGHMEAHVTQPYRIWAF